MAGWEFLAVVEPLQGGNLIRQLPAADVADGELIPWRHGPLACDHCGTVRRRHETFIVRADGTDPNIAKGTYKQVGRNCLGAFLGGKSAAHIIALLGWSELVTHAGDDGEGGWGGGSVAEVFDLVEYLSWVAGVIRQEGWTPRSAANSERAATADLALRLLRPPMMDDRTYAADRAACRPGEVEIQRAQAALAWARALPGASDYERNLGLIAQQPWLVTKHAGILASALSAHTRALGREVEYRRSAEPSMVSVHVGTVGARLEIEVTLDKVVEMTSDYGPLNILVLHDATHNRLVWKTGTRSGMPGDVLKLKGTVKAHTEYRGEKQTELTRCKVL